MLPASLPTAIAAALDALVRAPPWVSGPTIVALVGSAAAWLAYVLGTREMGRSTMPAVALHLPRAANDNAPLAMTGASGWSTMRTP